MSDEHQAALAFWEERRICFLANVRPDGTPHVVPVGVTFDPQTRIARVITDGASMKARLVERSPEGSARVAVSQVDGGRWSTLEGVARVRREPEVVADAERRYAVRYREPRVNPTRVVIEIAVDRVLGTVKVPLPPR
jgi:PPOX class probable F420-dependent enzyme